MAGLLPRVEKGFADLARREQALTVAKQQYDAMILQLAMDKDPKAKKPSDFFTIWAEFYERLQQRKKDEESRAKRAHAAALKGAVQRK
jgi:hypothetical protein